MNKEELNIKSSTVEKSLEIAKDFLGKLISPTVEELGLLMSDNIKFIRFKNQVRILLKAKKYVEERNISISEIPVKILVPLLEKSSLEDTELLQDKWAKMLVNMVDSEKNLKNQIFPYILGQISQEEFIQLKNLVEIEKEHLQEKKELYKLRESDKYTLKEETKILAKKVGGMVQSGFRIYLEEYEIANLLRLGLVRALPPKIFIQEFATGGREESREEQWHQIEAEYDADDFGYRVTELGEKFIQICEFEFDKTS